MKFICLCMSPALDATVTLPRAPEGAGEIFKDVLETVNTGGKAVNVARWLALRGADVACGGLLGEENDAPFVREMAKYGIEDRFMRVKGETRRNEMIAWPGGSFKLNRPAFPGLDAIDAMACLEKLIAPERGRAGGAVAILSGSLPPAVPDGFYAGAVSLLKAEGFATVLDASGKALAKGVEARPDLIKPNAEECEAIAGFTPKTPDGFARATAALRGKAAHAIISDGGSGAWFDGVFEPAPKVEVVDTTAAGDTLLAEYCFSIYAAGLPAEEAARRAVAAGSAACTMPGGAPPLKLLDGRA